MMMKRKDKNKEIVIIALYTTFFVFMFAGAFVYGVNDDTGMRSMAIGAYSGTPDAHLQWLPYISGYCLSTFYKLFPQIDWYGFLLLFLPISSLIYVYFKYLYGTEKKKEKIVFIVTAILCVAELLSFQWTTSSAICGASALMVYGWQKEQKRVVSIGLFLLLSFFIREYTFFCICIGLAWIMIYVFFDALCIKRNSVREEGILWIKNNVLWITIVISVMFFSSIMDYKSYGSKEWIEYRGYCNSRAIVYDYTGVPQWENNEEFWRKLGIEEDTVDMLRMYQIGFLDDIGEKELTLISDYAKDGKALSIASKQAVILVIRRLAKSSYRLFLVPFFIFIAITIYIKFHNKRYYEIAYLIMNTLFWGSIASFFILEGKYPDRTEFIVLLCMVLNVACAFNYDEYVTAIGELCRRFKSIARININKNIVTILVTMMMFLPLGIIFCNKVEIRNGQYERNLVGEQIDKYFVDNERNSYVLCDATGIVCTKNFRIINDSITPKNTVETLGWGIRNPLWKDKIELIGGASINEIIFNENVYLCAYDENRALKIWDYLNKNIKKCNMKEIEVTDYGMHIYKLNSEVYE